MNCVQCSVYKIVVVCAAYDCDIVYSLQLLCLLSVVLLCALCGLQDCKNSAHSVSWPEVIEGVPNQGCSIWLTRAGFCVCLLCFGCMQCLVSCLVSLVVSISAIDCLERLISKMTYYVSSRTLNPTHLLNVLLCVILQEFWQCSR